MIHKFLNVSKHLSISSTKIEDETGTVYIIDLLMPLDVYWEVNDLIKKADYLLASDEQMADVLEIYKQIFNKTAHWAVYETDRLWLYNHGKSELDSAGSNQRITQQQQTNEEDLF